MGRNLPGLVVYIIFVPNPRIPYLLATTSAIACWGRRGPVSCHCAHRFCLEVQLAPLAPRLPRASAVLAVPGFKLDFFSPTYWIIGTTPGPQPPSRELHEQRAIGVTRPRLTDPVPGMQPAHSCGADRIAGAEGGRGSRIVPIKGRCA
jgi:hypothetical protein